MPDLTPSGLIRAVGIGINIGPDFLVIRIGIRIGLVTGRLHLGMNFIADLGDLLVIKNVQVFELFFQPANRVVFLIPRYFLFGAVLLRV